MDIHIHGKPVSVTLVIHAQTVQHTEMPFALYDRAMHNGRAVLFAVAELLVLHVATKARCNNEIQYPAVCLCVTVA